MKRALIVLTGTTVSVVAALNYTPHQISTPINDQTATGTDGFSFTEPSPTLTQTPGTKPLVSSSPTKAPTTKKPKTTDTKKPSVVSPKKATTPAPVVTPSIVPKQKTEPAPAPQPTPPPVAAPAVPQIVTVTGNTVDTPYGPIQVAAKVDSNGKIYDVAALKYPNADSRSVSINSQAIPRLRQETLSAQSANISMVSGASYTSQGWITSLQSLLTKT